MNTVKPALLIRPGVRNSDDAKALLKRGIPVVVDPYLVVTPTQEPQGLSNAKAILEAIQANADWLLVTSAQALTALTALTSSAAVTEALTAGVDRGLRVAAVGDASASAVHTLGRVTVHCPQDATAHALAALLLTLQKNAKAVLPLSAQALPTLVTLLQTGGWQVTGKVLYETRTVTTVPPSADQLRKGAFSAVVLRSPTAARALHQFSPQIPNGTTLVCGGPTTATETALLFDARVVTSLAPDPTAIADVVYRVVTAPNQTD